MITNKKSRVQRVEPYFVEFFDLMRSNGLSYEDFLLKTFIILVVLKKKKVDAKDLPNRNLSHFLNDVLSDFMRKNIHFQSDIQSFIYKLDDVKASNALHDFLFALLLFDLNFSELIELLEHFSERLSYNIQHHATPKGVASLLVELLKPKATDKILDPEMGTGSFLVALYSFLGQPPLFYGIEKNSISFGIAQLYGLLVTADITLLNRGNMFEQPILAQGHNFDVVLSSLPLGRMSRQEIDRLYHSTSIHYPTIDTTLNYLQFSYKQLKPGGRAAVLVGLGTLFSEGEGCKVRQLFVEQGALKAVITLPGQLLRFTGIRCAVLIFSKPSVNQDLSSSKIRLIKAEDCFTEVERRKRVISKENIASIIKYLTAVEPIDGRVIDVDATILSKNDYCLLPDKYLVQNIGGVAFTPTSNWVELGRIADIFRGGNFAKLEEGNEPIVRGRDIRVDRLDLKTLECKTLSNYKRKIYRTSFNDILLQKIGDKPAAYLIGEEEEGIAVSDTVFIIRLKEKNKKYARLLTEFINSEQGAIHLTQEINAVVVKTQSLRHLRKVTFPNPDDSTINLVMEMYKIETSLKSELERTSQLKTAIFSRLEEAELSANFNEIRLTAYALEDALKKKDDTKFKIRNLYPFPLAYPYRSLYVEREFTAIYQGQMKYGEFILSFLVSIGLSLIYHYRNELNLEEDLSDIVKKSFMGGISPGDWRTLLQKSCKVLKQLEDKSFAAEFASIWFKGKGRKESKFADFTKTHIVEKLNDAKHHRGPSSSYENKKALEEHDKVLLEILKDLEFLIRAKLYLIKDVSTHWRTKEKTIKAYLLQGDHPAFESIEFTSSLEFCKGLLYLDVGDEQFICLHPLLSASFNESTKREETCSLDKLLESKIVVKSFDSGHSFESGDLKKDFDYWLKAI